MDLFYYVYSVEVFISNLCDDLSFPEKIKRELIIQMKQQILGSLKSKLKKIINTFQNVVPPPENISDLSIDSIEKPEDDSLLKRSVGDKKKLNLNLSINFFDFF